MPEHECEVHCGRPAPHTYVCWNCIDEAQKELATLDRFATDRLLGIARREERPATRNTAGGAPSSGAGRDALNLGVWHLWHALTAYWPDALPVLPHDHEAAHLLPGLYRDLDRARILIHGEEEKTTTPEHVQARMDEIRPMQTHVLVPWMHENLGIRLTPERIKKWGQRGQLTPRLAPEGKRPYYHPADVLHTLNRK